MENNNIYLEVCHKLAIELNLNEQYNSNLYGKLYFYISNLINFHNFR